MGRTLWCKWTIVGWTPSSSPRLQAATQASHSITPEAATRCLRTTTRPGWIARAMPPQTLGVWTTFPHLKVCLIAHRYTKRNKCLPSPSMAGNKTSNNLQAAAHSNKDWDKETPFRTCMSLRIRPLELFNQLPLSNNKWAKKSSTWVTGKTEIKLKCRKPCSFLTRSRLWPSSFRLINFFALKMRRIWMELTTLIWWSHNIAIIKHHHHQGWQQQT